MLISVKILFKYCRFQLFCLVLTTLVIGILSPINTYLLKKMLLNAVTPGFWPMVLLYISVLFIAILGNYLRQFISGQTECILSEKLGLDFLHMYSDLEYSSFESPKILDAMSRVAYPTSLTINSFHILMSVVQQIVSYIGLMALFFEASFAFGAMSILFFSISFFFSFKEIRAMRKLQYRQTQTERKKNYISSLFLDKTAEKEIKVFDASAFFLGMYDETTKNLIKERIVIRRKGFKNGVLPLIASVLFNTFTVIYLLYLGRTSVITLAEIIALISALPSMSIMSTWILPSLFGEFGRLKILWKDYTYLIRLPCRQISNQGNHSLEDRIVFENVRFKYPNSDKYVLDGLNLTFEFGKNTALVGENGCGKSTVIKLLLGLYAPESGQIRVGNTPLEDLNEKEKKMLFTAVFQTFCIYKTTVKDNIIIADLENKNDEKRLNDILESTHLLDKVELTSKIGEIYSDGISLSGGQYQRIAIARGLFSSSKFCVLDEPTAALDPISESKFYNLICENKLKKSLVIISHRMPSAKLADKIYLLQDGKIKECGSHDELMAMQGLYCKMFVKQSELYRLSGGAE